MVLRIIGGGAGVVALSFWITLTILRLQPPASPAPPAGPIAVVEATYGGNCDGELGPTRAPFEVKTGNATQKVADKCNGTMSRCDFMVNVTELGDTAPACVKDFAVQWRCGDADPIRGARLAAEATGKSITLECPDK